MNKLSKELSDILEEVSSLSSDELIVSIYLLIEGGPIKEDSLLRMKKILLIALAARLKHEGYS